MRLPHGSASLLARFVRAPAALTTAQSLINGPTFVVTFLATGAHRCIAAPLVRFERKPALRQQNPAYVQDEVAFYLEDAKPDLILVHRGALKEGTHAVKAAQQAGVAIAEVFFDMAAKRFHLDLVSKGKGAASRSVERSGQPMPDDVALLLHTSGTTVRSPDVVAPSFTRYLPAKRWIVNTRLTR